MSDEQQNPIEVASGRSGPSPVLIIFLILIALAGVFFLQNANEVEIDFLVFEKITTVRWSILMAVVLGILLDRIFSIWWRRRGNKKNN
ncbi:MAG: hypothetical protein ABL953_11600 [Ilumatobacteraceae bacterium]